MALKKIRLPQILAVFCLLICRLALGGEPYDYYGEYRPTDDNTRKGTKYYYTDKFDYHRTENERAGTKYYYPEQYDISHDEEVETGTNYYYKTDDEEIITEPPAQGLREYYHDLDEDGLDEIYTQCLGNICYDYTLLGEILEIRQVDADSTQKDRQVTSGEQKEE